MRSGDDIIKSEVYTLKDFIADVADQKEFYDPVHPNHVPTQHGTHKSALVIRNSFDMIESTKTRWTKEQEINLMLLISSDTST